MAHWILWVAVAALVGVGVLSFTPYPGRCNVEVDVSVQEISAFVTNYFQISSVNAHTTGAATILDWSAWLAGLGAPALQATFTMTVSVGGVTTQKSESQWFPTVPFVNGAQASASDAFHLGQVPSGQQSVNVGLTQNGQTVATGSSSLLVGC